MIGVAGLQVLYQIGPGVKYPEATKILIQSKLWIRIKVKPNQFSHKQRQSVSAGSISQMYRTIIIVDISYIVREKTKLYVCFPIP